MLFSIYRYLQICLAHAEILIHQAFVCFVLVGPHVGMQECACHEAT